MFYLIYQWFYDASGESVLRFLRVLKSQPFRAACAAATGFLLVWVVMPWFIRTMRRKGVREQARHYSELDAGHKSEVPTMGGLVMIPAILAAAFLWCDPLNRFVYLAASAGVCGALLGAVDDLAKWHHRGSDHGLSRAAKYAAQIGIGLLIGVAFLLEYTSPVGAREVRESVYIPFVKTGFDIGWWNLGVIVFFLVVTTNAVNLTDGMDGLAAVPSIFVFLVLGLVAYLIGHAVYGPFLQFFPYAEPTGQVMNHGLPGAGELGVLCCAAAGACAGFLWYNAFPATVMMGDTGSLALGAMLGAVAVVIRQEAIFVVAGGVFIMEIASSFIQDHIGLTLLGRRIFFRAPYHSTLLHRGISESKVTVRLWILSGALAVGALALLKLR